MADSMPWVLPPPGGNTQETPRHTAAGSVTGNHSGQQIGKFGIRRWSKQEGHDDVANQLLLNKAQALDLAKCPFTVDDYIDHLIDFGERREWCCQSPDSVAMSTVLAGPPTPVA